MKAMLKLMLILALCFASTFVILNVTGVITIERIKDWFEIAQQTSPILIGLVVSLLLFADLFVAMPTLTIMILSGFFLGPIMGATFSITGLLLAGVGGYGISSEYDAIISSIWCWNNSIIKSRAYFARSQCMYGRAYCHAKVEIYYDMDAEYNTLCNHSQLCRFNKQ